MTWQPPDYKDGFLNTWTTDQAWHYAITDARKITDQEYGQGEPIRLYLGCPGEVGGCILVSYAPDIPFPYNIPVGIEPSGEVENCTLALLWIDPAYIRQSPLSLVQFGRAWEEWDGPMAHCRRAKFIRATSDDAATFLEETGTLEYSCVAARCNPAWTIQGILDYVAASDLAILPYPEYLKTDHWQAVRKMALERAGGRCQLCNSAKKPHDTHHRTYERRGFELPEDVIVLCRSCHQKFHNRIPRGED